MTTVDTYRTTLSRGPHGNWRMFVALPGLVADWPTEEFGAGVPTIDARAAALAGLGYEITDPDGWTWCEDTADDGGVILMAGTEVRANC